MKLFCTCLLALLTTIFEVKAQQKRMVDKFVFTGSTSVVFPRRGFEAEVSPAFSATSGVEYLLTSRLLIQATFAYNRHKFASDQLHLNIYLQSKTELLSLYLNGRFLLLDASCKIDPYLISGLGYGVLSQPSIHSIDEGGLVISSDSRNVLLFSVGSGVDVKLSPTLILYLEFIQCQSFNSPPLSYLPVAMGFRTYPADLLRKK